MKRETPKISVIVPVYNQEMYIDRCINSIVNQTFSDIEIILVDDGSVDTSGTICDGWKDKDERIKVIHKENGGLSSARNAGLDLAKGDYIGFIDSDDYVSFDMYEHLLNLLEENKADISSISYELCYDDSSKRKVDKEKIKIFDRIGALEYYSYIGMKSRVADYSVCIKLYKRELFQNIRFPVNKLYEDIVTNFKLLQKSQKYVKSDLICYFYFQNPTSIVHDNFKYKDLYIIEVGKELLELSRSENSPKLIRLSQIKIARGYLSCLLKLLVYGYDNAITNIDDIIFELVTGLRRNLWDLLISPMPLSRKLAALFLSGSKSIDIFLVKKMGSVRR